MTSTSIIVLVGCILVAAAVLAAASHHKKSGTGEVKLIGATGLVETTLDPHGTVLIQGELWRACSDDANAVEAGSKISVVGMRDQLLLVRIRDQ